jgi:CBS domain-containing protein
VGREEVMTLKEIMTRDVEVVSPDATLQEAARILKTQNIGSVPVCDGTRIQGMITDRDIAIRAVAEGRDPFVTLVRDVMTPEVIYCMENQSIEDAAHIMEQQQIRRLVILNENKDLVGIVSLGDLATEGENRSLTGETLEAISQPGKQTAGSVYAHA